MNATVNLGVDLSLTLADNGGVSTTLDLASFKGPITTVLIGDVPIAVQFSLTPFLGANLSPPGGISAYTGVSTASTLMVGLSYANGVWSPIGTATSPTASPTASSVDGPLSLKGLAGLKAGATLDGFLTPYFSADGYLQFTSSLSTGSCWSLNAGMEGNVGVDVDILGVAVVGEKSPDLDLYTSPPLLQGTTTCFAPVLTGILPNAALAGSPQQTLALAGSNFVPDSVVYFNGLALATTFVDPSDLTAVVPASDLAVAGTFPVTVTNPDSPGGTSSPVNFTVTPQLAVASLSFDQTSILPGASTTGTVTLNYAAPPGGVSVGLNSSNTSVLPVPAAVEIGAGLTTATFTATSLSSVTAATPVSVSASYNNSSQSATVTVAPLTIATLSFNPTSIAEGASTTGTVTLSANAPAGGTLVTLSSNSTGVLTVPANVKVPAGSTSATFTATASASVATSTQVTVTATYNASSQQATVTVNPVVVTVTPSSATLAVSQTQQFTANVTGTSNSAVDWSVNGIAEGNSTEGTISSNGLYTAPGAVPNPTTVTVTATSEADPSASGSATVTISSQYSYSVLYSFTGRADGGYPVEAGVILDASGNLYSTTIYGGITDCTNGSGCGTVFMVDPTGNETVLYSFTNGPDGAHPEGGVVQDAAGNLYGTTNQGGTGGCTGVGCGVVFKVDPTGKETTLFSFPAANESNLGDYPSGATPEAGLVLDAVGNLYGTTLGGASALGDGQGLGAVFEVDTTGNETVLHSFTGAPDGARPEAGLVRDAAGNLYGTTFYGGIGDCDSGSVGCGTVFMVDPTGNETVLYSFTGAPDGAYPLASLVQDAAGNLYGTTVSGGSSGNGTVFKIDATGQETVLHSFSPSNLQVDGAEPRAGLILDIAGNLYGTTSLGGAYGFGTVFMVDTTGKETILYSFTGGADGGQPEGQLVQDAAGNLYGNTVYGGDTESGSCWEFSSIELGCGTVFKLTLQSSPSSADTPLASGHSQ